MLHHHGFFFFSQWMKQKKNQKRKTFLPIMSFSKRHVTGFLGFCFLDHGSALTFHISIESLLLSETYSFIMFIFEAKPHSIYGNFMLIVFCPKTYFILFQVENVRFHHQDVT